MVLLKLIWNLISYYPLETVLIISAVIMVASIRHSVKAYRRASLPPVQNQGTYQQNVQPVYTK